MAVGTAARDGSRRVSTAGTMPSPVDPQEFPLTVLAPWTQGSQLMPGRMANHVQDIHPSLSQTGQRATSRVRRQEVQYQELPTLSSRPLQCWQRHSSRWCHRQWAYILTVSFTKPSPLLMASGFGSGVAMAVSVLWANQPKVSVTVKTVKAPADEPILEDCPFRLAMRATTGNCFHGSL